LRMGGMIDLLWVLREGRNKKGAASEPV